MVEATEEVTADELAKATMAAVVAKATVTATAALAVVVGPVETM